MKKFVTLLLVLTGMVTTASAVDITLYYAVPSATVGSYTVKANIKTGGGAVGDNWETGNMTKTAKKFTTYDIYSYSYSIDNTKFYNIQFQLYDGSTWKSQVEPLAGNEDISNFNGKMYVHDKGWTIYNYDITTKNITIHCKKNASWTPNHAYAFYYNGSSDVLLTNAWTGDEINPNTNNSDYYDLTISSSVNYTTVIFNNNNSGQGTNQTWDISIGSNEEYWTKGDEGKGGYAAGPECWYATTDAPADWIGYKRTSLTAGNFGTICLPYAATVEGATVFKIVSKTESAGNLTGINLESVDELEAGKAYIFKATGTTLTATYSGSYTGATEANGMLGTYTATTAPVNSYVLGVDNKIHKVTGDAVNVGQNKAWITLTGITTGARGLDFLEFDGGTTGIETVKANQTQNGEYFNLAGQRVAQPTKGLYIVNGKKVIIK